MADSKISALTAETSLASDDMLVVATAAGASKKITGANLGLLKGSLPLTAAQILAFDGTSNTNVVAVAAPGSNKALIVVQAMAFLTAGATPFADGGAIAFGTGVNGGLAENVLSGIEVRSATSKAGMRWQAQGSSAALTEAVDAPLIANCYEGVFSAGNGSVRIEFVYYVADLA